MLQKALHIFPKLMILAILSLPAVDAASQGRERVLEKQSRYGGPIAMPVEIVDIRSASGGIAPDQPFTAQDDWLTGLTVTVKNVSDQPINYVEMNLRFPATGTMRFPFSASMAYGRMLIDEAGASADAVVLPEQKAIEPGASVELVLGDGGYRVLRSTLERLGASSSIDKVTLSLAFVVLADGRGWRHGHHLRRDPNNPGRWNVIRESSGPGR